MFRFVIVYFLLFVLSSCSLTLSGKSPGVPNLDGFEKKPYAVVITSLPKEYNVFDDERVYAIYEISYHYESVFPWEKRTYFSKVIYTEVRSKLVLVIKDKAAYILPLMVEGSKNQELLAYIQVARFFGKGCNDPLDGNYRKIKKKDGESNGQFVARIIEEELNIKS